MTRICFLLVAFSILVAQLSLAEEDDFCQDKKHYTGSRFTCCNSKKFEAPKTNPFVNQQLVKECLTPNIDTKLVPRTWRLYKCMLEKEAGKSLNDIDSFAEHMLKRFSSSAEIQTEIRNSIEKIKESISVERKRRKRADDDETPTDSIAEQTAENQTFTDPLPFPDTNSSQPTLNNNGTIEEDISSSMDGVHDSNDENSTSTSSRPDTTTATVTDNSTEASTVSPPSSTTPEPDLPSTTTAEETPSSTGTSAPVIIPVYRYLSVYEYINTFKEYIPDQNLLRSWDVYFVAEFEACHRLAKDDEKAIKQFGTERCLSWIQRTARDGECCGKVPIPMPLQDYPLIDREEVQNHTADKILSLAGKYIWTNLTYSSNIDRCHRLSLAVLQGHTSTDEISSDINLFLGGNITTVEYRKIAEKLIPSFYPKETRDKIVNTTIPTVPPGDDEPRNIFQMIELDSHIQKMSSGKTSIYELADVEEWDKPDKASLRYLMWTCDAYKMISLRIKYFDVTEVCY